MLIGLDLLHARPRIGGAWNHIGSMMDVLKHHGGANTYIAYCTQRSECLVPEQRNFIKRRFSIDAENPLVRTASECATLQLAAKRDGVDVLHVFSGTLAPFRVCPNVVTFYDFVSDAAPTSVGSSARCTYFRIMRSFVIKHADVIAAISATTANEIVQRFPAAAERVIVIPFALGSHFHVADEISRAAFRAQYNLPERFWLYVAHYYPHKNHERLFQAYSQLRLRQPDTWPLVLRGSKNGADDLLDQLLAAAGIRDSVIWLPSLSETEMALLYSSASALVYPTLYEGAGLPLVEAMACGCPVAAADIPTTREFCQEAALTFDPYEIDAIADAMARMSADEALQRECAERGLLQAQRYRPERVASLLAQAYEKAARTKALRSGPV